MVNYKYWMWEDAVPKEYCELIINSINEDSFKEANVVYKEEQVDLGIRRTDIVWDKASNPAGCILQAYMNMANTSAGWNFYISSIEDTQIGRYRAENKGFYDWHIDSMAPSNGVQRKLSAVLLLNNPDDFEGGVLQFKGCEDEKVLVKQGSIVVFPSFIEHKVTPITAGVRYSAVNWASGPSFK